MKHFKDLNNQVHAIEGGYEHLLPEGCVEISIEDAREIAAQNAPKQDPKVVARDYLQSTDWYVIRKQETKKAIPKDVIEGRAIARAVLSGETE